MNYLLDRKIALTNYFIFYFAVFIFFAINHRLLSQFQPIFFTYNRDIAELFIITTGLPKFMINHSGIFILADLLIFIIPIIQIAYFIKKSAFSIIIGLIFTIYLFIYFLLHNIFTQGHLEASVGYLLLSLLFITNQEEKFYTIIALCRYMLIYVFFSAALWKIARGAIFNYEEMSNILISQHNNILNNNCSTLNCNFYFYLINNPAISYMIYLVGVMIESFFIVGFFTRKFDKLLFILIIIFLVFDHLLMRIPYWTIMVSGMTLFMNNNKHIKTIDSYLS